MPHHKSDAAEPERLVRAFGLLQATALNMSNMVGVGPFLLVHLPVMLLAASAALPNVVSPEDLAAANAALGLMEPVSSGIGVCLLAGWCALVAPRPRALAFWVAALLVFGAEQLWAESDAGWASWSIVNGHASRQIWASVFTR